MTTVDTSVFPIFYIKQGDQLPTLRAEHLLDGNGAVVDLSSGIDAVYFNMADADGNTLIERGAVHIIDAAVSDVEYLWQPGDTDVEPGTYLGEFEVVYTGGGRPARFPNYADIHIIIAAKRG